MEDVCMVDIRFHERNAVFFVATYVHQFRAEGNSFAGGSKRSLLPLHALQASPNALGSSSTPQKLPSDPSISTTDPVSEPTSTSCKEFRSQHFPFVQKP